MLDLLIRGGHVIDGTGSPRRRADVGVIEGRIVLVGATEDDAIDVIDATDRIVAPGLVDVHTHLDAQVFWDGSLSPSPLHGVTTVLAGNCGFSIAPLPTSPADVEYLMSMLSTVEGMPIESLRTGVPWTWSSTAEYLAHVEGRVGLNIGFMVGHSAIRRTVMGPDAVRRTSTPEELESMRDLLRAGLDAGGLGFSSSWARTHTDSSGNWVPSRHADRHELIELCRVVREFPGTAIEMIPSVGDTFEPWAVELMTDMSVAADRPLNWNVMTVSAANLEACRQQLEAGDHARRAGGSVTALAMPINFPIRLSFASGFVLDSIPGWEEAMHLPPGDKLALLRSRDGRDHLARSAEQAVNPVRRLTEWADKVIYDVVAPENESYRDRTVGAIALEQGRDPWEVLCDIVVADELYTSFGAPLFANESDADWHARVEIIRDPRAIVGGSDAGAHLDMLGTYNYGTELLGRAVRERALMSFEEAIHLLTARPARMAGLKHRGIVREGFAADVVVLDPRTIGSERVALRFDLPAGAPRLYAGSTGVEHVFVNGRAVVRDGQLTDERPGAVIRSGRDTDTAI